MIEVERNNGGVHNVERILVQNSVNVCVYVCICKWEQHRSVNVCIYKKCECMHMHMCVCSPPPLPLPLPLPAKSHSLSSSAFALSAFVSLLPQLLPQLLHHSALPPLPGAFLVFLQSMLGSDPSDTPAWQCRITLGQLLSPRIMATPALVTSTCARQGSRQKGIGSQERPQVVSPNGGSIRALMQKPRQIEGGKSETKADAKSCRS